MLFLVILQAELLVLAENTLYCPLLPVFMGVRRVGSRTKTEARVWLVKAQQVHSRKEGRHFFLSGKAGSE